MESKKMKILIINGPNLNLLGIREPQIYGMQSLNELNEVIIAFAELNHVAVDFIQSNHEGEIIDVIQGAMGAYDGIVINPAAYTHYSIAIRDAISSVGIPTIEVHLSDVNEREAFRKISMMKDVCLCQISGKGVQSYIEGIEVLIKGKNDANKR